MTLRELAVEIMKTLRRQGWMSPLAYKRHTHLRLRYALGEPAFMLSKSEAMTYLAWIKKGNFGRHFDMRLAPPTKAALW